MSAVCLSVRSVQPVIAHGVNGASILPRSPRQPMNSESVVVTYGTTVSTHQLQPCRFISHYEKGLYVHLSPTMCLDWMDFPPFLHLPFDWFILVRSYDSFPSFCDCDLKADLGVAGTLAEFSSDRRLASTEEKTFGTWEGVCGFGV